MKALGKMKRQRKPWYSDTFGFQLHKLEEILSDKYSKKAALVLVNGINQTKN